MITILECVVLNMQQKLMLGMETIGLVAVMLIS